MALTATDVLDRERDDARPASPRRPWRPSRRLSRPAPLLELSILSVGYFVYASTRVAVRGSTGEAMRDGRAIFHLEQVLHIAPERWLNTLLTPHAWLSEVAGYYYATLHFAITPAVLVWLYWRHPGPYRTLRTALVATTLPSLLIFWLYPTAPPRFAVAHLSDTLEHFHIDGLLAPRASVGVANLYAAMPSLHVAWAAWCALGVWTVARHRHRYLALLGWLYPIATTVVVLATANHYLLDTIAGVAALAGGILIAVNRERITGWTVHAGRVAFRGMAYLGPVGYPPGQNRR